MHRILLIFLAAVLLISCSEFNKAQKSNDVDYKQQVAEKYYAKQNYERAIPLLEELIALRRGTAESERVNYLHAMSTFWMKDYTLAAYYLNNFVRTFPTSKYAEECAFLAAYCFYKNSPNYELDQGDTRSAIDQLQLFLVRYPNTTLRDSSNTLIDRLRSKLEVKSFHAADQYYRMRNFQAAGVAFRNFVRDWPNSKYREDAMFQILRADYQLALNSVEAKRLERVQDAIRSYHNFVDAFPNSAILTDAERIHRDLTGMLDKSQNTTDQ